MPTIVSKRPKTINDFAVDLIEYYVIIKGRKSVELSVTVVWE